MPWRCCSNAGPASASEDGGAGAYAAAVAVAGECRRDSVERMAVTRHIAVVGSEA